jgi:hypothetical protein
MTPVRNRPLSVQQPPRHINMNPGDGQWLHDDRVCASECDDPRDRCLEFVTILHKLKTASRAIELGRVQSHPKYVVDSPELRKAMGDHGGPLRRRREGFRIRFPLLDRLTGARMQNAGGPRAPCWLRLKALKEKIGQS